MCVVYSSGVSSSQTYTQQVRESDRSRSDVGRVRRSLTKLAVPHRVHLSVRRGRGHMSARTCRHLCRRGSCEAYCSGLLGTTFHLQGLAPLFGLTFGIRSSLAGG